MFRKNGAQIKSKITLDSPNPQARIDSKPVSAALLAEPIHFKRSTLVARNRFMKSAMSERVGSYSHMVISIFVGNATQCGVFQMGTFELDDTKHRGVPTSRLIRLYEKYGGGEYGLIVTGNILEFLEGPGNIVMHREGDTIERWHRMREWTKAAKADGALFIAQLTHPGSQANAQVTNKKWDLNTMTKNELNDLVEDFVYAAAYAKQVGFDGIELACSYFFALGSLLSADINKRTDTYGGSLENRSRLLFKIIEGIRQRIPNNSKFIVGLKLTSLNFEPNYDETEFLRFVKKIEESTVDYVTIAGGHFNILKDMTQLERQSSVKRENFYQTVVNALNKVLKKTPVYMNGGFVTVADMVEAVKGKWTSGIAIARPVCQEPDLPKKILAGKAKAAVDSLIDVNDFMTSISAGGAQNWAHGDGVPVFDLSNPKHVEKFKAALVSFTAEQKANPEKIFIGFPKLEL